MTGTDVAVSVTGVAGPSELEGKPVGTVYIGISHDQGTVVKQLQLSGNRETIKLRAAKRALYLLWELVK